MDILVPNDTLITTYIFTIVTSHGDKEIIFAGPVKFDTTQFDFTLYETKCN